MSETVLLVEPNDDIRHLMTLQLRKENYTIFAFKEAKEALHWLQYRQINNLIVSKEMLEMPVEHLIKVAKTRDVWVIAMTTSPFKKETMRELEEMGADVVLWKPYTAEQLYRALIGLPSIEPV